MERRVRIRRQGEESVKEEGVRVSGVHKGETLGKGEGRERRQECWGRRMSIRVRVECGGRANTREK